MHTKLIIPVFIMSLLLIACATSSGKKFDESHVSQIKKGETTQDQILGWFGEPNSSGIQEGKTYWQYSHVKTSDFGSASIKALTIFFDEKKIVTDYSYGESKYQGDISEENAISSGEETNTAGYKACFFLIRFPDLTKGTNLSYDKINVRLIIQGWKFLYLKLFTELCLNRIKFFSAGSDLPIKKFKFRSIALHQDLPDQEKYFKKFS